MTEKEKIISISKEDVVTFLHSTYTQLGIKRKLCEKCDSPSSKMHQGIWCDNCPGQMIDRSGWTVLGCTERLENSLRNFKKLNNWALKNLLITIGVHLHPSKIGVEGINWAWRKENEDWVIGIYRNELSKRNQQYSTAK